LTFSNRLSASSSVTSFDTFPEKEKGNHDEKHPCESIRSLKLFESPLAHDRRDVAVKEIQNEPICISISGPIGLGGENSLSSWASAIDHPYKDRFSRACLRNTPEFKRYEEATNIELFYDLFFVANLTTFTNIQYINEVSALKAYAGFFCILWFLWAQVSLFDVRFVQDSIFERTGKACQFGIMVGLAIVGPNFNPSQQEQKVFQTLALILMMSRVILGFQYMVVLREVWYYKDTKMPLFLIVTANFVAAFMYLGTYL
jgi:hypothetical protein